MLLLAVGMKAWESVAWRRGGGAWYLVIGCVRMGPRPMTYKPHSANALRIVQWYGRLASGWLLSTRGYHSMNALVIHNVPWPKGL